MINTILQHDVMDRPWPYADGSVQCVVTSPPYFGLRDYGVDGQIGLEATPEEYVDKLVKVFREVRRVLRDDGTLWLNLGDSYARQGGRVSEQSRHWDGRDRDCGAMHSTRIASDIGMKEKDLIGIPWMVAFALRADGWYLRQDIVWAKPNPIPESVTDRCTKSHEYIFLLTRSPRYYFDADAIAEPVTDSTIERISQPTIDSQRGSDRIPGKTNGTMKAVVKKSGNKHRKPPEARGVPVVHAGNARDRKGCPNGNLAGSVPWEGFTRNKRSVWTVPTTPFKEAHFATFPQNLIVDMIKAGSRPGDIVLDPFSGAGTTALVARKLNRNFYAMELNPDYIDIANRRLDQELGMFR